MKIFPWLEKKPFVSRIKTFNAGERLFLQGQKAGSMFLILRGRVRLIGGDNCVVSLVGRGQCLGEKSILEESSYLRAYTAVAEVTTDVLELTGEDIRAFHKKDPDMIFDVLMQVITCIEDRFDRASYLVKILRSSDNIERMIYCILHLVRTAGLRTDEGTEVILNPESIHFFVDIKLENITELLKTIADEGFIVEKSKDVYLIRDERSLIDAIPKLNASLRDSDNVVVNFGR